MRSSYRVPADPEGYRLIEPVDRGEMRSVWRARHLETDDIRLVSLLPRTEDSSSLARIEQETQLLTKLPDVAIAGFSEIVPHEAGWALIAEDRADQSLRAHVGEHGPASAADAVCALVPVAEALAATHRIKIVHGDVNSATVLVTATGRCVLGEFGVSRYLRDSRTAMSAPTTVSVMAAPEIRRDERALPAADVYGFGRVLLSLLSGDPELSDPLMLVSQGKSRPSASLVAVLEQCLQPDPFDRPADGEALIELLSNTTEFGSVANHLPTPSLLPQPETDEHGQAAEAAKAQPGDRARVAANAGKRARLGTAAIALVVLVAFAFAVFRAPASAENSRLPDREPKPRPARSVTVSDTSIPGATSCTAMEVGQPVDVAGRPIPRAAERFDGDLDGDGCPDRIHWWAAPKDEGGWRAHATFSGRDQPVILTLGDPGDLLFLGAWACEPARTPALYRPHTGEVFTLTAWPAAGEQLDLTPSRLLSSQRNPTVITSAAGCDTLVD